MQEKTYCYKKIHRVYYYETDKMGRVYHSNYLNWMEEARTEFLRSREMNYKDMENIGIFLPISDISLKFIKPVEYDEEIAILVYLKEISRIKITFFYEFYNEKLDIKYGEATSTNLFTGEDGKLKRVSPDLIEKIKGG
ncbi:MAG: acyl-CoA thioesterase [Fusobacteria bacterium]|nr:acyl-CoA thioesterase [Fusobacteriota bacterium]